MVRVDNKTGNLIIEIKTNDAVFNELMWYRASLYDAIGFLETNETTSMYALMALLRHTEPTDEQWKQILEE